MCRTGAHAQSWRRGEGLSTSPWGHRADTTRSIHTLAACSSRDSKATFSLQEAHLLLCIISSFPQCSAY